MRPTVYAVQAERTSPIFARAFAQGCGGQVEMANSLKPGPVALFGSPARWELLQHAIRDGRDWYYGDHGYFGRGRYFRITKNAYQHSGRGEARPNRFRVFRRPVQPWQRNGRHVLICPNSPTHFRLFGLDVHQWTKTVVDAIGANSTRPVRVRWKGDPFPIQQDLQDCWAVVTFSSAAALDALIAGIPVFVLAEHAAAYRFGLADVSRIEQPVYPEGRQPFLWNLAANQWTLAEITSGCAWRALATQAVAA